VRGRELPGGFDSRPPPLGLTWGTQPSHVTVLSGFFASPEELEDRVTRAPRELELSQQAGPVDEAEVGRGPSPDPGHRNLLWPRPLRRSNTAV